MIWRAALAAAIWCGMTCPAPAAPPPLDAYGALPSVELVRLSPQGDKIASIAVSGADRKLVVTDTDGKLLHDVNVHDLKVRQLDWADDDHVVLTATVAMSMTSMVRNVSEYLFVASLNVPQHRLHMIFSGDQTLLPMVFGEFGFSTSKNHAYGYFGGISQVDVRLKGYGVINLYRVDLDTRERAMIARGDLAEQDWLVDPATAQRAAAMLRDDQTGEWRIMSGDKTLANGRSNFGPASIVSFGRQAGTLLVREPTDGEDQVRELKLDGSAATDIADGGRIASFLTDRSSRWIGQTDDLDYPRSRFFDPAAQGKWEAALKTLGRENGTPISWTDAFDRFLVFTEGTGDAGTYWLVDTTSGAAKAVGHAYADITSDQVGEVRMVDWKAADGQPLRGVLTLPPGKPGRNLPLVVLPHGGPQARDYPHFDWWAQAFASRGYAVFQPNFRGSAGYGEAFVRAGYGEWGRKMQTDISDGVAALAAQGVVDPKRACIVGGSYGGYAALAGVTVQHGLYRCAVSWGGVADPEQMIRSPIPFAGPGKTDYFRYWRRFMGVEGPSPVSLDPVSPIHLADHADAPILLMYGQDDSVVAPVQSQSMADALKRAGKPYDLTAMPGEDHWLSKSATRVAMLKAAVAFVEKYDPAD